MEESEHEREVKVDDWLKAVGGLLLILLVWWCFLRPPQPSKETPTPTKTQGTFRFDLPDPIRGIVVNVKSVKWDDKENEWVVDGNVKNFTNKTFRSVWANFNFFDADDNLLHTSKVFLIYLEDFLPGAVKSFRRRFPFEGARQARTVRVIVVEAQE